MKKIEKLRPVFVAHVPEHLVDGDLYISVDYGTVVHRCCCGCGSEVVTPLSPTDWRMIFDGDTVSLDPSIGNWSFPCRSHYWILRNQVRWARAWSDDEVALGRETDQHAKAAHFAGTADAGNPPDPEREAADAGNPGAPARQLAAPWWRRAKLFQR